MNNKAKYNVIKKCTYGAVWATCTLSMTTIPMFVINGGKYESNQEIPKYIIFAGIFSGLLASGLVEDCLGIKEKYFLCDFLGEYSGEKLADMLVGQADEII